MTLNWCSYQPFPLTHLPFVSQLGCSCSLALWGPRIPAEEFRRCVSWENKPRSGPTAPRRLPGYSSLSCVWLRFPLHCVKVVIKKYGLCGCEVFWGPQSMLSTLCPVIPGWHKANSVWPASVWISLCFVQIYVTINIRVATLGKKKTLPWHALLSHIASLCEE